MTLTVQRMCETCGQPWPEPRETIRATSDEAARATVIRIAAQHIDVSDPSPFWLDAYGSIPEKKYFWCGVFALYCLRKAGLTRWKWITGIGFLYVNDAGHGTAKPRLPITKKPQIGDIGYFDLPWRHYALVERIEGTTVHLIAGNTPDVGRSEVAIKKATAYFSLAPLLPSTQATRS